MVGDGAFSHKIDYGHLNRITDSRVMGILLNGGFCLLVELQQCCHNTRINAG